MLLVNPLYSPLEILLLSSGTHIDLTVVTQGENLGHLIIYRRLGAESRITAAGGSQQIGEGNATIANDGLLVPCRAEHSRKDLSRFPDSAQSKEASSHAEANRRSCHHPDR